jgi:hypothetical protein
MSERFLPPRPYNLGKDLAMARKAALGVEGLERRSLLSGVGDVLTTGEAGETTVGVIASGPGAGNIIPITPFVLSTVSTNKASYKVGQSVRITMDMIDTKTPEVAPPAASGRELITILRGTTAVWEVSREVQTKKADRVEPAGSVQITTVWNGRPNVPRVHKIPPGVYTINITYGDYIGSTTIAIGRKGL